jgi:hypothetical protein
MKWSNIGDLPANAPLTFMPMISDSNSSGIKNTESEAANNKN